MRAPSLLLLALLGCRPHGLVVGPRDSDHDSDPVVEDDTGSGPTGPRCQPVATIADPNGLEGQAMTFSLACASGEAPARFEAALENSPAGARFDAETWSFAWTPGLDQGGRYDLLLSVRPRDGDGGFPETTVATLWIADAIDDPANVAVDPATYTEEWGLPVFHLAPLQSVGQTHVPTDITVYGHTYRAEMKIRGAASASYPKPSYTLRFSNEDLDAGPWGMGNKDHLYAITTFDDNSYVRTKLAYDLWIAIAEHFGAERLAPRTFFAVIYLNGDYRGVYTMSDRPDDHFAQEMGLNSEGNLYKAVSHYANFYRTYGSSPKSTLHDGYEKTEGEPAEGQPGAFDDLDALVAWSADASHETFWAERDAWLRVDEFMDWLIFVQWLSADDSAGKNSYLYNDPEAFEFRYCPWDFNHSYGQGWYTYRIGSNAFSDYRSTNGVFDHLQGHPEAAATLWERYHSLQDEGPLEAAWMRARTDEYYALIEPSAERDWAKWAPRYAGYWGNNNTNNFVQERAYLEAWIEQRDAFMRTMHP